MHNNGVLDKQVYQIVKQIIIILTYNIKSVDTIWTGKYKIRNEKTRYRHIRFMRNTLAR
jgi:hypothetical protein